MTHEPADSPNVYTLPFDDQIKVFLDEHRSALDACLDGLTESQARTALVASKTTLLGLVKHATFVERVWFDEAFTGRTRAELGIVDGPDESFELDDVDDIVSVRAAYRAACRHSRDVLEHKSLDDVVSGNRRGDLPIRWIMLHVLREVAQHCGHADILREQLLADRSPAS